MLACTAAIRLRRPALWLGTGQVGRAERTAPAGEGGDGTGRHHQASHTDDDRRDPEDVGQAAGHEDGGRKAGMKDGNQATEDRARTPRLGLFWRTREGGEEKSPKPDPPKEAEAPRDTP